MLLVDPLRKPRAKRKRKVTIPGPYHALAMVMFADTFSGRMLRRLCLAMVMPQADFMSDYMRRCDRKLTRYAKPGQTKPNPSSFQNNFGRFLISSHWLRSPNAELRVIRQDSKPFGARFQIRCTLVWVGPRPTALILGLTDVDLERFSVALEAQMLAGKPTDSDARDESAPWLAAIRNEIAQRSVRSRHS